MVESCCGFRTLLYPGYQRFFFACDEELCWPQAEDTSGEVTETEKRARKASGTRGNTVINVGNIRLHAMKFRHISSSLSVSCRAGDYELPPATMTPCQFRQLARANHVVCVSQKVLNVSEKQGSLPSCFFFLGYTALERASLIGTSTSFIYC